MLGVCKAAQRVMVAVVVLVDAGGALDLVSDRVEVSGVIDTITDTPLHGESLERIMYNKINTDDIRHSKFKCLVEISTDAAVASRLGLGKVPCISDY